MAAFDANLTDTLQLDDSTVALYDQSFLIEADQTASMEMIVIWNAGTLKTVRINDSSNIP